MRQDMDTQLVDLPGRLGQKPQPSQRDPPSSHSLTRGLFEDGPNNHNVLPPTLSGQKPHKIPRTPKKRYTPFRNSGIRAPPLGDAGSAASPGDLRQTLQTLALWFGTHSQASSLPSPITLLVPAKPAASSKFCARFVRAKQSILAPSEVRKPQPSGAEGCTP